MTRADEERLIKLFSDLGNVYVLYEEQLEPCPIESYPLKQYKPLDKQYLFDNFIAAIIEEREGTVYNRTGKPLIS